jgi:hypothetical protein
MPDSYDEAWDSPEMTEWATHVREELIPMIRKSAVSVLIPGRRNDDVKFACEVGLSVLLDKPLVVLVAPGAVLPPKLEALAEHVVHADLKTPEGVDVMQAKLRELAELYGRKCTCNAAAENYDPGDCAVHGEPE